MKGITIIAFALMIVMSIPGMSHGEGRWVNEEITISPKVLVLDYSGTRITIHTNIPASEVVRSTVYIDIDDAGTVEPCSVFADDCGNLVAKFRVDEVKLYIQPPGAVITLHGDYLSGGGFSAAGFMEVK